MGLLLIKRLESGATIGLWRMEEAPEFFLQSIDLQTVELEELGKLKGRRIVEWLACRYLVHEMLLAQGHTDRLPVLKDEYGKPHLCGSPLHLSFSHSHDLVAVILANQPTGVDIQALVEKIERLALKFMREDELASLKNHTRLAHLHFYWGAKEALYKAYGRRELDFRQHIRIQPFDYQSVGNTMGQIMKDGEVWEFEVFFERFWDYFLVWTK
jgi:4'-phosphopantetheinyl transferase